ncbi:MAG: glycoside hydrolase family 113 [Candidatus Bipolaricaulaceae bacterium]
MGKLKAVAGVVALVVAAGGVLAAGQAGPAALAISFLLEGVTNQDMGLYTHYAPPPAGREILLQNVGLLMQYAVLTKDRPLLDAQRRLVEENFLDPRTDLLHWRLDGDMQPLASQWGTYANAPGDSLRVAEALLAAHELWGEADYQALARRVGSGLLAHNVGPQGALRAYASWTQEGSVVAVGQTVVLAHLDLPAMAALARDDPAWEGVAARSLGILLGGMSGQGLFYHAYQPSDGAYVPGEGSLIAMAQAALQLAGFGQRFNDPAAQRAAGQFLDLLRAEYGRRGVLPARYDVVSGHPAVSWENLAVYALAAQLAFQLGDAVFGAQLVDRHVLPQQNRQPVSPLYGAFTSRPDNAYTYDTLEALLALAARPARREDRPIRGVWYLGWDRESYARPGVAEDLKALQARLCPTHIGLFAVVTQAAKASSDPGRDPVSTVSDETLREVIARVHRLGMGVMLLTPLFPADGTWEGAIQPADVDRWFAHWREILLHYAELAEGAGVEVLLLGSELATLRGHVDRWNELIFAVRSRYRGKISYSVNFWANREEYRQVMAMSQWRHMDYIGVTGYFELTEELDPSIQELEAGWRRDQVGQDVVADLQALSRAYDKPIVFWEIGYQSKDGAAMYPWKFPRPGREDEQEQADAWRAFLNVFWGRDWFAGYGICAEHVGLPKVPRMYSILGKRAEAVLAEACEQ